MRLSNVGEKTIQTLVKGGWLRDVSLEKIDFYKHCVKRKHMV